MLLLNNKDDLKMLNIYIKLLFSMRCHKFLFLLLLSVLTLCDILD